MASKRTREEFEAAVRDSFSIAEMCRHMGLKPCGGNYRLMHNAIDKYGLDTGHFRGQGWNTGLNFKPNQPTPIEDILTENSSSISRNFTDKKKMRDRVINKTYCEPLPQLKKAADNK